jgi:SAM-dependent methyltransferase
MHWEARYGDRATAHQPPSPLLDRARVWLPPGCALDLACGNGRHTLWLARHGWSAIGIDFAFAGLRNLMHSAHAEGLPVAAIQADLEQLPLPRDRFDVVVNIRYLQRSLFPSLQASVRRGGVIVFETFLREHGALGHPRNPAFLLDPGELAARFSQFETLLYDEGRCETESGPAFLARAVMRRP